MDIKLNIIDEENPVLINTESEIFKIKDELKRKIKKYKELSGKHKQKSRKLKYVYYCFSSISTIVSIIVTALSGNNMLSDGKFTPIFFLALVVSLSTALSNHFNLEPRSDRHHNSSLQFHELYLDLKTFLSKKQSTLDCENYNVILTEKEKILFSSSLDYGCWMDL